MKASELVQHLQAAIKFEGDLELKISAIGEDLVSFAGMITIVPAEGEEFFLLCDHDSMDNLS